MRTRSKSRRGAALMVAVLFLLVLGGMAASLAALGGTVHKEHKRARQETLSFYAAEAGINEAYATLVEVDEPTVAALAYPQDLGSSTYSVEIVFGANDPDLRLDRIRMRSVGDGGQGPEGVQLMVWRVPTGFFRWACFGFDGVRFASNALIDSYNSNDGPYPGWSIGDFGNIGSNESILFSSNDVVMGDVVAGPAGAVDDTAPGVSISGIVDNAEVTEVVEPIVVPVFPSSGNRTVNANETLPPGDYHFDSLEIKGGGRFTIEGPARVVIGDMLLRSNGEWIIDAMGGPVEIYGTGDFDLRSNSILTSNSGHARDIVLNLSGSNRAPDNDDIYLNSNSDFVGTVYAPYADVTLESNFEIFGAIRAGTVTLNSNSALHFDEDLLYDPNVPMIYERLSWRRLSQQEIQALGF